MRIILPAPDCLTACSRGLIRPGRAAEAREPIKFFGAVPRGRKLRAHVRWATFVALVCLLHLTIERGAGLQPATATERQADSSAPSTRREPGGPESAAPEAAWTSPAIKDCVSAGRDRWMRSSRSRSRHSAESMAGADFARFRIRCCHASWACRNSRTRRSADGAMRAHSAMASSNDAGAVPGSWCTTSTAVASSARRRLPSDLELARS
jgi:hypothetical protein